MARIEAAHAQTSISVLLNLLHDDDLEVRLAALWAVGEMGPLAHNAAPALSELLINEEKSLREAAASSLKKINQKE